MDQLDARILDALQSDFPLTERPYAVMAKQLGLTEQELWQRI